jgi:hypothetical protein
LSYREETRGTKSSYVEKAGQGVGPKGKARGKKETPPGQNFDTAGGQDGRGRPAGRELKLNN